MAVVVGNEFSKTKTRTSAFPESGRSDTQKTAEMKVRFRPILLKNSVLRLLEYSKEFLSHLARKSQINCAVLCCVRPDFHATSATPSYIHYAMPLKSQMKSPLISKRSFSTVSANSRHSCHGIRTPIVARNWLGHPGYPPLNGSDVILCVAIRRAESWAFLSVN